MLKKPSKTHAISFRYVLVVNSKFLSQKRRFVYLKDKKGRNYYKKEAQLLN